MKNERYGVMEHVLKDHRLYIEKKRRKEKRKRGENQIIQMPKKTNNTVRTK